MDLDEYLFFEKRKDPTFTHKKFAKKLGISASHLSSILNKRFSPAGLTYKIWEITEGKVDIGKLLIDYFEHCKRKNG